MNQEPSYAKLLDTVRESGGDVETMTAFAECVITAYKAALAQRTWVGLTEERIKEIWLNGKDHGDDWLDVLALARAFEADLKEKNA